MPSSKSLPPKENALFKRILVSAKRLKSHAKSKLEFTAKLEGLPHVGPLFPHLEVSASTSVIKQPKALRLIAQSSLILFLSCLCLSKYLCIYTWKLLEPLCSTHIF